MDALNTAANAVASFVVLYPLAMSWMGIVGAWLFQRKWEKCIEPPPTLPRHPRVSVLVSCDASPEQVERTLVQLEALHYPHSEILALNDGTIPLMGPMLDRLMPECPRLRVVHAEGATQRAVLLRTGAMLAQGEFLVCVEPSALVEAEAVDALLHHFLSAGRVGAVVGQAMVLRPRKVLDQVAAAEFTLRAQALPRATAIYGKQFVPPAGLVAYRKSALHQTGYWKAGAGAPELQLLWALQAARWSVRFEPNARYWIEPPRGILNWLRARNAWRGQLRQAVRVLRPALFTWRNRRLWFFHARHWLDLVWNIAVWMLVFYALGSLWLTGGVAWNVAWFFVAPLALLMTSLAYVVLMKQRVVASGPNERPPLPAMLLAPGVYWLLNLFGPWAGRQKPPPSQRWKQSSVSAR